ncbi:DUF1852 domain-containing protein [Xinfangfangia sp. D13-10-4-6]|uniref:DUF1852 domain-containing protein n=1 Tax=Pseudogemmobacter hezensis TaxID=2737662 RepID=UPI0015552E6F|nr:DUF1852 domain-containing protein [Pseudogemmobacter hezensis]NPD16142.1 DUF1852 domain-containing protein [Pseudogemmobacter hezensis]
MTDEFTFRVTKIDFDEDYIPAETTRITTNFANLARGQSRKANLHNTLRMIDNRFNALACWDNPAADRYAVGLEIISVDMTIDGVTTGGIFPLIELLRTVITDRKSGDKIDGAAGNNFSSYVRDYDFSVLLPAYNRGKPKFDVPQSFGELHGNLFRYFVKSEAYRSNFNKPPVICLSVSSNRTYHRTDNCHPILGFEYRQDENSLTDRYFEKMGMQMRCFMPAGAAAPLAFYFMGDLLSDYTNLELISAVSTMETFQKIYRPEIYNANSRAGAVFQPSLSHQDFSLTQIVYDREERSRLASEQGKFAEEHFIKPHQARLEQWSANFSL